MFTKDFGRFSGITIKLGSPPQYSLLASAILFIKNHSTVIGCFCKGRGSGVSIDQSRPNILWNFRYYRFMLHRSQKNIMNTQNSIQEAERLKKEFSGHLQRAIFEQNQSIYLE